MISYDLLWDYLYHARIKRTELADKLHFGRATLAKMGKNQPVSLEIIDKIGLELGLEIEQMIKIVREE